MRLAASMTMFVAATLVSIVGCRSNEDPAAAMIRRMDALPPAERIPNWEQVKALMQRPAPEVGAPAPDFTLKTLDGNDSITLSEYQPSRSKVLIFGSYT